jgi:hypothetical protein
MAYCGKVSALTGRFTNTCYAVLSSRPAGFGFERLATAFMDIPGDQNSQQAACLIENALVLDRGLRLFPELRLCGSSSTRMAMVRV